MPTFRNKPIVIEARQFDGTQASFDGIRTWVTEGGGVMEVGVGMRGPIISIWTRMGNLVIDANDWVIRDADGAFYPCKPTIFEATYDAVAS